MGKNEKFPLLKSSVWSELVTISKKDNSPRGGVLRSVVVFVYSSVGSVLFKKAILLVAALESILQQRDRERQKTLLLFQAQARKLFNFLLFLTENSVFVFFTNAVLFSQFWLWSTLLLRVQRAKKKKGTLVRKWFCLFDSLVQLWPFFIFPPNDLDNMAKVGFVVC